eukprot:919056-Rhodomonas_salina.3
MSTPEVSLPHAQAGLLDARGVRCGGLRVILRGPACPPDLVFPATLALRQLLLSSRFMFASLACCKTRNPRFSPRTTAADFPLEAAAQKCMQWESESSNYCSDDRAQVRA